MGDTKFPTQVLWGLFHESLLLFFFGDSLRFGRKRCKQTRRTKSKDPEHRTYDRINQGDEKHLVYSMGSKAHRSLHGNNHSELSNGLTMCEAVFCQATGAAKLNFSSIGVRNLPMNTESLEQVFHGNVTKVLATRNSHTNPVLHSVLKICFLVFNVDPNILISREHLKED